MSTREVFAANLSRAVGASGLTQAQVAIGVGLSPSSLSRRLHGHARLTVDDVARLARVLDVNPADLLTLDERKASV